MSSCNKAFAKLIEEHIQDPTALFWVSAMGAGVDISLFKSSPKRVVWDYDDKLLSTGLIKRSGAIILREGQIDTIIQIDARNLQTSFDFLSDKLWKKVPVPLDSIAHQP